MVTVCIKFPLVHAGVSLQHVPVKGLKEVDSRVTNRENLYQNHWLMRRPRANLGGASSPAAHLLESWRHRMKSFFRAFTGCLLLLANCLTAEAQSEPAPYRAPDDIAYRQATIISEGSRLERRSFYAEGE